MLAGAAAAPSTDATPAPRLQSTGLDSMPVGAMVSIVKLGLATGHAAYQPISLASLPPLAAPPIEPGRLEVRLEEFYKKVARDESKATRASGGGTGAAEYGRPHRGPADSDMSMMGPARGGLGFGSAQPQEDVVRYVLRRIGNRRESCAGVGWRDGGAWCLSTDHWIALVNCSLLCLAATKAKMRFMISGTCARTPTAPGLPGASREGHRNPTGSGGEPRIQFCVA